MRHQMAGRTLGRNASHRLAMFRNMAASLIQHERIVTTVEKAKELRPFIEKLITLAKKDTLHAKRLVIARLGPAAKAPFYNTEEEMTDSSAFTKLFADLAPRFADRPGGYTRILKRHERRLGDAGRTAFIELLQAGETKPERKKKAAPAQAPAPAPEAE